MKSILLLGSAVLFFGSVGLAQQPSASYVSETRSETEVFSTKVLKVYSVESDGQEFIAYVVDWRGSEVVVVPSMLDSVRYKEGDSIRCIMTKHMAPAGAAVKGGITFSVARDRTASRDAAVAAEIARRRGEMEAMVHGTLDSRLEAVAEEVARRRAERGSVNTQAPILP